MDPVDCQHRGTPQHATPSVAAVRLAAALAERLDTAVPPPFRVRAQEGAVVLYRGEVWDDSLGVAAVLDWAPDPSDREVRG